MTVQVCRGNPQYNGLYAVRQWYCWRILEWYEGAWWYSGRSSKWPLDANGGSGIEAWSGPLPVIAKDYTKPTPVTPARRKGPVKPPVMEFDL